VRTVKIVVAVVLALVAFGQQTSAQSLAVSLFARYLESLRLEAGIPGISAAIVQNGRRIWDQGFGYQDVDAALAARADTPYPINDLSQTIAATLLLQHCLDSGRLEVSDRMRRWVSQYPDDSTTVRDLLTHAAPAGAFKYDSSRFAALTEVVEQCRSDRYAQVLTGELLDRLGMIDSVPSHDIGSPLSAHRLLFPAGTLARYDTVLQRVAVPYRVDGRSRASRSQYQPRALDASTGIVSTVRDLARFDAALGDGVLVTPETLALAWEASESMPTGLGWFVQRYNGERLVWHFGQATDAYSSLVLKIPARGLTLILLANSDRLSAPFALPDGDVTTSIFARLFLKLFVV
jgi:CubicO group peptidase (beta-lactamase class C family)